LLHHGVSLDEIVSSCANASKYTFLLFNKKICLKKKRKNFFFSI